MKKLIAIIGPNGVGKSTTARALLHRYYHCAYVDADWCRAMNPFPFTQETKKTVIENIYCMLKNYLLCEDINIVVFPYGFHGERKEIFDTIINRLRNDGIAFVLFPIILKCSFEENLNRAVKDGRDTERIERGIRNTFNYYDEFKYPCIVTTKLSPEQVAECIAKIIEADGVLEGWE